MLESIISISLWELTFFIINFLKNNVYRNGIHPHNHGYYQHQISSSSLFESINRLAPRIDPLSFNLSGFPSITGSFTQYHQSIHSSPSDYWLFLEGPREQKSVTKQIWKVKMESTHPRDVGTLLHVLLHIFVYVFVLFMFSAKSSAFRSAIVAVQLW